MLQPGEGKKNTTARPGRPVHYSRAIEPGVILTPEGIERFLAGMRAKGRAEGTLEWYRRGLTQLYNTLPGEKQIRRGTLMAWRETLRRTGYAPRTINLFISSANSFLDYVGLRELQLTAQLKPGAEVPPELSREEYLRLLQTAKQLGNERVYLLIKVFATTELTVQELPKLTVEAVRNGQVETRPGGVSQIVRLPVCLQSELLTYAARAGRYAGSLFVTHKGTPLSRTNVSTAIRQLCEQAQVAPEKGNPRCLRRLYQATRKEIERNVSLLVEQTYERLLEAEQTTVGWKE